MVDVRSDEELTSLSPPQSYLKTLRLTGFELMGVEEWGVTEDLDENRKHPEWPNDGVIPRFLLVAARKPDSARGLTNGEKL